MTFPSDENGDVLRRMQANGDNLEKARDIDFNYVFPEEEDARQFSAAIGRLGYDRVSYEFWQEKQMWDVQVIVFMVPGHAEITRIELSLDAIAREFFGRADGWGCFEVK